jgi:hypothetical protein
LLVSICENESKELKQLDEIVNSFSLLYIAYYISLNKLSEDNLRKIIISICNTFQKESSGLNIIEGIAILQFYLMLVYELSENVEIILDAVKYQRIHYPGYKADYYIFSDIDNKSICLETNLVNKLLKDFPINLLSPITLKSSLYSSNKALGVVTKHIFKLKEMKEYISKWPINNFEHSYCFYLSESRSNYLDIPKSLDDVILFIRSNLGYSCDFYKYGKIDETIKSKGDKIYLVVLNTFQRYYYFVSVKDNEFCPCYLCYKMREMLKHYDLLIMTFKIS